MKYKLVKSTSPDNLEHEVNELLFQRYYPHGSLIAVPVPGAGFAFVQAMIKRNNAGVETFIPPYDEANS